MMSWSIIFETKMVRLTDGKILWFTRQGCNNDNVGRDKGEFRAKVLTENALNEKIQKFKESSLPFKEDVGFDLKIGSRFATWYDYGTHLERMLKRALCYTDFIKSYLVRGTYLISVDVKKPIVKTMEPEEFSAKFYNLLELGTISYIKNFGYVYPTSENETEVLDAIEKNKGLEFYIVRRAGAKL